MNFGSAISAGFSNYATFSGRARRSEYWYFALFYLILSVACSIVDRVIGSVIPAIVLLLVFVIPLLSVAVRRLHDIDRTGWWLLFGLIPLVGTITLIVFDCKDSDAGANNYGPSPKYEAGGARAPGYGGPSGYGYPGQGGNGR